MRKVSLKTLVATALAVVTMSVAVFANTLSFTDVSRITPETCWVSNKQEFQNSGKHTVTASFQKTYAKGTAYFKITKKFLGIHIAEAQTQIAITKGYSGIAVTSVLSGTVDGKKNKILLYFRR